MITKPLVRKAGVVGFAVLGALAFAGCSTPKPARDLAAQGALVTDQAQTEAQGFLHRATLLYRAREGVVRDLADSDVRDASKVEFNTWLSNEVGLPGEDARRAERITRVLEKSREVRQARADALAANSASIAATFGEPVKVPPDKLAAAKKAFLNLAQELTAEEWLKFSQAYAKEVNDNLKAMKPDEKAGAGAPAPASPASAPNAPKP